MLEPDVAQDSAKWPNGPRQKGQGMGLLRRRNEAPKRRYQMKEKLLAIGDDYWIEDESGARAFKVNGKVARLRDTWILEDPSGVEVARIRERALSVRDAIKIDIGGAETTVKKALVGIRDRFHVEMEHGEDLKVHGNIVDHEYEITRDGDTIAEISKKWFRVRDSYGIELEDTADPALILAVAVAVDALAHD